MKHSTSPNRLAASTSPYLLQHARNPVDWYPWCDEAWDLARREDKLVLVSIGYSACHWCHVMEREVFEKEEAAEVMNAHFICIKVDREERPDVDQVYMTALQLMTGHGGWPLNVFCLPDGRPVYGGTYLPLDRWLSVLEHLHELHRNERGKVEEYAAQLAEGVRLTSVVEPAAEFHADDDWIMRVVEHWRAYWDRERGGARKAPKFPMPTNLDFLLDYALLFHDEDALGFVRLTLDEMARGGLYDQVGGGFARYSVDAGWKVPHFEKMLYDNAQLVAIYSKAARATGSNHYIKVVHETMEFVLRELTSPEGLFWSALDADSEGIEGRYYCWTDDEMKAALGHYYEDAAAYYHVGREGYWEHGLNILLRREDDHSFAASRGLNAETWSARLREIRNLLFTVRQERIRPGLDNKCITSWNALMVGACAEAWKATGEASYLEAGLAVARQIAALRQETGRLQRLMVAGGGHGPAFLDDYAWYAESALQLHACTSDPFWLDEANDTMLFVLERFSDDATGLFWFTEEQGEQLFSRNMDIADNVIPSANSSLCRTLFLLGHYLDRPYLIARSRKMLDAIQPRVDYGASWSNWLVAFLWHTRPFHEVVVHGPYAQDAWSEWHLHYVPNSLLAASTTERSLPLFRGRFSAEPTVYVCSGNQCQAPVRSMQEALRTIG